MHEIRWYPPNAHPGFIEPGESVLVPVSSIPGWKPHSRRLDHTLSSLNRQAGHGGVGISGVAVMLNGSHCVVAYYGSPQHPKGKLIEEALGLYRDRCLTSCEICGKPARALVYGSVRCPTHEIDHFRAEAVFNPRQISRHRRVWMADAGVKLTQRMMKHAQWPCVPVYDLAGASFVRAHDAPPGQRQAFFEALVDAGHTPEELSGCWVFRLPGASK